MPGRYPTDYIERPWAYAPEQAYRELDGFTFEEFTPAELGFTMVLLPPLSIAGVRTKGLLFSAGVDALSAVVPAYRDAFLTIANSRWGAYPWSEHCDAAFVCYDNPARANWYREVYPSRARRILIPRQTADYTDELLFKPDGRIGKDIDVLIVCRIAHEKNLIAMADFLTELRRRDDGKRLHIVWATDITIAAAAQIPSCSEILSRMQALHGDIAGYIDWMGPVASSDMPKLYRRSKMLLLPSLVEGKNRAVVEAMCSDVPVVILEDFNAAARGLDRAIPAGAGLCVKNTPAAVADGITAMLDQPGAFSPRQAYLKTGGRENFLWDCLGAFDYFREALDLGGGRAQARATIDAAMREQYGLPLTHFLHYAHADIAVANDPGIHSLHRADGRFQVEGMLEFYDRRWRANA
jgi:glycosyltransferase involved in cell wall biosynthesis